MKKFTALMLGATLLLSGCGQASTTDTTNTAQSTTDSYKIGIAQFAAHGSLDNCREGFKQGLEEAGITNVEFVEQNAQAETAAANQIAQSMAADKDIDLICAIATPMAQAAYNAAQANSIPVIFTAVTDPVAASLANEDGTPVGEVTGTSDKLAVDAQLQMIREFMPDAQTIGILYSTSETNSISAIAEYKELAPSYGFEIVESGISQAADIPLAATDLAGKVDCMTNLTDNTVVTALPTVLEAAGNAGIPVFGSEIEQVKNGCVASEGIDYVALGKQTGEMAARVLKGEKAAEIPFETITEYNLYINSEALAKLNISVPDTLADSAVEAE
jgi:putative ABC transport system substrate-binding protein